MSQSSLPTMHLSQKRNARRQGAFVAPNNMAYGAEPTSSDNHGVLAQMSMFYTQFEDDLNNLPEATESAQALWADKGSEATTAAGRRALKTYKIATAVRRLKHSLDTEPPAITEETTLVPISFEPEIVAEGEAVLYYADDYAYASANGNIHYITPQTRKILDILAIPYRIVKVS